MAEKNITQVYCLMGYECDNNCLFCAIGGHQGHVLTEDIKSFLSENMIQNGNVLLTGGEPSIRPDFIEVAKYLKETYNANISILTHAMQFADAKFADAACEYLDVAHCSFYAHNERMYDYVTRGKNTFSRTVDGIKNLIDHDVDTNVRTLANIRPTYRFLEKITDIAIQTFDLDKICFSGVDICGNVLKYPGIVVPLSQSQSFLEKAILKSDLLGAVPQIIFYPLCLLSQQSRELLYHTKIDTEISSYIANDVCECESKTYDFAYGRRCDICMLRNKCGGVWRLYLKKYGENELRPIGGLFR